MTNSVRKHATSVAQPYMDMDQGSRLGIRDLVHAGQAFYHWTTGPASPTPPLPDSLMKYPMLFQKSSLCSQGGPVFAFNFIEENRGWWYRPIIPMLKRLRPEDQKCKSIVGNTVRRPSQHKKERSTLTWGFQHGQFRESLSDRGEQV